MSPLLYPSILLFLVLMAAALVLHWVRVWADAGCSVALGQRSLSGAKASSDERTRRGAWHG